MLADLRHTSLADALLMLATLARDKRERERP